MADASRLDADWKQSVPPELIPAVEHIRSMFADTEFKSRRTTEVFCYAALHPADTGATEEAKRYLPTLEHLQRHRVSTATLQTFEHLTNRKTPPSVLHAYFVLYQQVLEGQCKAAWGDLLRIAPAGPIQQRIEWAEAHVKGLIQHAKCNVAKWLMGCCDGHVSGKDAMKWQAPSLAWMHPALNKPYEPTKTWKRESIEDTQRIESFFEMGLECCLRTELQVWRGVAHLEAAKKVPVPPEPAARSIAAKKRGSKSPIRVDSNRRRVIFGAIQSGLKGLKYCVLLDSRKVRPPDDWKEAGCPDTYTKAYRDVQWRKRIQDEKCRCRKQYDKIAKRELEAIIQVERSDTRDTRP